MARFIYNYGSISLLLIVIGYLLLAISAKKRHFDEWEVWKMKHDRRYKNEEEEARRKAQFTWNLARINAHNNATEKPDFVLGLNQFADLDRYEFVKRNLGLNLPTSSPEKRAVTSKPAQKPAPTTKKSAATTKKTTTKKPPTSLDWRKLGAVTPVEEQGSCAGCWAFSTTGALEGRLKVKTGKLIHLSEQNLLDCSRKYGNSGCQGGWMEYAYDYIVESGGLNTAASYPYKGTTTTNNNACKYNAKTANAALAPKKPYFKIAENNDTAMIEALQSGPVSVAFDSSQFSFQAYSSGIYAETECSGENVNHAMLLVGYGTDSSTRKPYWIVKNSFGTSWGEKGYMRVARGGNKNICGMMTYGNYPILK